MTSTRRRLALCSVAVALSVVASAPSVASAQVSSSGQLAVTSESGAAITSGGNTTPFLLRLPSGAACQGDSADDGYTLMSFMIPSGEDPGTLTYPRLGPEGEGRFSLYSATTSVFSRELTQDAPNPGDPGIIGDLAPFGFVALDGAEVSSGEYRIGIACVLGSETTRYWDAVMTVTRSPADEPATYSFEVVSSADAPSSDTGNSRLLIAVTGGLVLIGLVAFLIVRRHRTSTTSESKEIS